MVGICGHTISNRLDSFLDRRSRTVPFRNWDAFPVQVLYGDIIAHNTFRSIINSLCHPRAKPAVQLLRSRFAGVLDNVRLSSPSEVDLADSLTAEGVSLKQDLGMPCYRTTSPLIDQLVRSWVIPVQFPNAPSSPPPYRNETRRLYILDALIESIKFFDRDLIRTANSYKLSSGVRVCGHSKSQVPRESVYDTELMRIFSAWLGKLHAWTVTGQWHLRTALEKDRFTDIVLQKDPSPPIVLELLATGDPNDVKTHIEKTPAHMALVSANEGWIVHFTCEDDYRPIWQSDAELDQGLNVVHFWHNLSFTQVQMWARWKDDTGAIIDENRYLDV